MALYYFFCDICQKEVKKLLPPKKSKLEQLCKIDGSVLIRTPKDITTSLKEVIDTGLQARKIEQIAGAPGLLEEREHQEREKKKRITL